MSLISELSLPCNLSIDLLSNARPGRPNVILSSGYGIFGFEEPVQKALVDRLDQLNIGWVQYTYAERNPKNTLTDLLISSGTATLIAVYDWLRAQGPLEIGLFGISFGANVTLEAALQRDPTLLLLINPVFDYIDYRTKQLGSHAMATWERESRITMEYDATTVVSYYRFIEEARNQHLLDRARSIGAEIIACQGDADPILTTSYVQELASASERFSSTIIAGADHVFGSDDAIERFLEAVSVRLRRWA